MGSSSINDSGNTGNCLCDPLKIILQEVLRNKLFDIEDNNTVELSSDYDELVSRLHLFYRSAVLRFPVTRGQCQGKPIGKVECRISEDTVKMIEEWRTERRKGSVDFVIKNNEVSEKMSGNFVKSVVEDQFGNVALELDIDKLKGEVIRWMISTGWQGYSRKSCHNQLYRVEIAMSRAFGLTPEKNNEHSFESSFLEYQKILVAQAVTTLLKKIGHYVDETGFRSISVPVGITEIESMIQPSSILVAGTVIDSHANQETDKVPEAVLRADLGCVTASDSLAVQDVLSKRLAEIKQIGESRRSDNLLLSSWATSLDNLTRATLHYDLLYRPLENAIQLVSLSESGQMNNNALFIMYNYSRVLSILRKFGQQVENGEYPPLPHVNEVEFNRLCEREEELQLLQLIMEWPRVMESSVNFVRFQLNLVIICKFLLALAKAFNSFYFQIVVLVPTNASHNFSRMMARIYLIKAICTIFEDCLDILQVNHANSASPPPA